MNRLTLVLTSIILVVLLSITGILFYAFSQSGNAVLKNYIEHTLEDKTGLNIDVRHFTLEAGKSKLIFNMNKQANIEIVTHYDLLNQSFKGIYRVKAKNFHFKDKVLRQLNVSGNFKGKIDDMRIEGKGTALDAALVYRFSLLEHTPKNIEVLMQGIEVDELLMLAGQPPLATGKIDVDIHMPEIGNEFANGYGHVVLHKTLFDTSVVKKMYDLQIPKKSEVTAKIDVTLKGDDLLLSAKAKSNLFVLHLDKVRLKIEEKRLSGQYMMDVNEMGILTQNKLAGALKVEGTVSGREEGNEKIYRIEGLTHSLGGTLKFDISEHSKVEFQNIDLEKIQYLTRQVKLTKGFLSGNLELDKDLQSGAYTIAVDKGQFIVKNIEKEFGYQIPSKNHYTLVSTGKIVDNELAAEASLKSSLSDVKLTNVKYVIKKKKFDANYDIFLPNVGLLMPDNKAVKRGYISLKGELSLDKALKVSGTAKGLGEKLAFSYDGKKVILDAKNLFIEKLLSLADIPRYVKGKLSSKVNISDIEGKNGIFSFKGEQLVTQPLVMERLMGKKLSMQLSVTSKGEFKSGVARLETTINTSMGNLDLKNTVYDDKNKKLTSSYTLDIPALEKTYALTQKKLYGPMSLSGELSKGKILELTGKTISLGGNIKYSLHKDTFKSEINKVPAENILALMGYDKFIQGDTYGTMNYDIQKKSGVLDVDIKAFKIKPNSATQTVKMFIKKDPSRIIYTNTKLHAKINGDITTYTLHAKGTHSSIQITEGRLDKKQDTHRAKFLFVYEKYEVTGTIGGTIDKPRILVNPSSIMQSKTGEKIQKKLDKALGGEMGKAVGGFLKNLKF